MASFYHDNAICSVSVISSAHLPAEKRPDGRSVSWDTTGAQQVFQTYVHLNRGVGPGHVGAAPGYLIQGKPMAMQLFSSLPAYKVNQGNLSIEVVLRNLPGGQKPTASQPNLATVLLESQLTENPGPSPVARSLIRTVVIAEASPGQLLIVNDMIRIGEYMPHVDRNHVRGLKVEGTGRAAPHGRQPRAAAPAAPNPFVGTAAGVTEMAGLTPQQQTLMTQLRDCTRMKLQHCRELLTGAGWDGAEANRQLQQFIAGCPGGVIPVNMLE